MTEAALRKAESEKALEAAIRVFTRLDGAVLHEDGDLRRIVSGRPFAAFNHVVGIRLAPGDVERRVREVGDGFASARALPATWWTTSLSSPTDIRKRLSDLGLREDEPEFGMVIDLEDWTPPAEQLPAGIVVEELPAHADLTEWTAVMAASYGWNDPAKADAMAELYRSSGDDELPWNHVLVTRDGRPVASGSLFTVGGHAFVTNIGTVPEARGLGLGSAVTVATLRIAKRLRFARASLTASVMGRSMYARLGFRDEVRIDRHVQG